MKQVIVMRTDLGMRKGKMIAQGAHASLAAVLEYVKPYEHEPVATDQYWEHMRRRVLVREWLENGKFTKICVRVDSERQLLDIHQYAKDSGLITCLITDSGATEFHGVPTVTCCAIGPDTESEIDAITGDLKLL